MKTKICLTCKKRKSLLEFSKNRGMKGGRLHHCKECRNRIAKDIRKADPEKSRKYFREYYAKNIEKQRLHRRNYNRRNRKKRNEYFKIYYDKYLSKNIAKTGWEGIKRSILKRDNYTCQECGLKTYGVYHKDGSGSNTMVKDMNNDPNNLVVLCPKCCFIKTLKKYKGDMSKGKHMKNEKRTAQILSLIETMSLASIGRKFKITRQRVSQIVKRNQLI